MSAIHAGVGAGVAPPPPPEVDDGPEAPPSPPPEEDYDAGFAAPGSMPEVPTHTVATPIRSRHPLANGELAVEEVEYDPRRADRLAAERRQTAEKLAAEQRAAEQHNLDHAAVSASEQLPAPESRVDMSSTDGALIEVTADEFNAPQEVIAETMLQRIALEQLERWDPSLDLFSAKQAFKLVRYLRQEYEAAQRLRRPRKDWYVSIPCDRIIWFVVIVLLIWIPIVIGTIFTREFKAESSGVLLSADSGRPMAAATVITLHAFSDIRNMQDADLRRIRDCTFVHGGAVHQLQVASLVRTAAGEVHVMTADRAVLRIEGLSDGSTGVSLTQSFYGKEQIDLGASSDQSAPQGCSFTAMSRAPARVKP